MRALYRWVIASLLTTAVFASEPGAIQIQVKVSKEDGNVRIKVENRTDKVVSYNSLLTSGGFKSYLFDSDGKLISPDPKRIEEDQRNDAEAKKPKDFSHGWESYAIPPGGIREISGINLTRYYGERWKEAAMLYCIWDPGLDWGDKPTVYWRRRLVGDGLTGKLDMSPITGKTLSAGVEIHLPEDAKVVRTKIEYDKIHPEVPSAPTLSEALAVVRGSDLKKTEREASVIRDGINVTAKWGRMVDTGSPAVVCDAINQSQGKIWYTRKNPATGYALRLFTPEGGAIETSQAWRVRNYPSDRFPCDLSPLILESGETDKLSLDLEDAFGPDWKNAAILAVNWYQDEPTSGKRLPITTVLDLSGLTGKSISLDALRKKVEAADGRVLNVPSRRSGSSEETKAQESQNTRRTGWWIGGVIAVLTALGMFLKKRNP